MLRGRGLNKFSPTGTPRERHAATETNWFRYGCLSSRRACAQSLVEWPFTSRGALRPPDL